MAESGIEQQSAEPQKPFYVLDLSPELGGSQEFKTVDDFRKWINDEYNKWQWMLNIRGASKAAQQGGVYYNNISNIVSDVNDKIKKNPIASTSFDSNLTSLKTGEILTSFHPAYSTISKIVSSGRYERAGALVLTLAGTRMYETTIGVLDAILYQKSMDSSKVQEIEEELNRVKGHYINTIVQLDESIEKSKEDLEARNNEWDKALEARKEELKLKPALEYWKNDQLEHHNDRFWNALTFGMGGTAIGIFAIVLILIFLFPEAGTTPPYWQIGLLATTVTATMFVIYTAIRWINSSFHMREDVAERAKLIQTYLAMIQDGGMSDDDRAIMLASIFRNASTGLIKDEGIAGNNLSLQILGKLLAKDK